MAGRVVRDEAIVYRSVLCQCKVSIFTGLPTLAHRTLISEYALYPYLIKDVRYIFGKNHSDSIS
jgi:hypothetical protein